MPSAKHSGRSRIGYSCRTKPDALYAIAGALYGLGGVLEAARTGGATNNYGNMYRWMLSLHVWLAGCLRLELELYPV